MRVQRKDQLAYLVIADGKLIGAASPDADGNLTAVVDRLVADGVVTRDDLDLHLTSLFPFVRLRNYLEVRYLDAVEWSLARGVLALLSGLIYCPTATARAQDLSDSLLPEDAAGLVELHENAARYGLDARDVRGNGFRDLARQLLTFSGKG